MPPVSLAVTAQNTFIFPKYSDSLNLNKYLQVYTTLNIYWILYHEWARHEVLVCTKNGPQQTSMCILPVGLVRVGRALGADAASVLLRRALPSQLVSIVVLGVSVSTTLSMARSEEDISRAIILVARWVSARVLTVARLFT